MQDSFSFPPDKFITSAAGKRMLNPYCTRCRISLWMNYFVEVWGPFVNVHSRVRCILSDPVRTWMPSSAYFRSSGDAGCQDTAPGVPCCLEVMKAVREGTCFGASGVSRSVVYRLSIFRSKEGGYVACAMFAYGRASMIPGPNFMLGVGIGIRVLGAGALWVSNGEWQG